MDDRTMETTTQATTNEANDYLVVASDGTIMRYSEYLEYIRGL